MQRRQSTFFFFFLSNKLKLCHGTGKVVRGEVYEGGMGWDGIVI